MLHKSLNLEAIFEMVVVGMMMAMEVALDVRMVVVGMVEVELMARGSF